MTDLEIVAEAVGSHFIFAGLAIMYATGAVMITSMLYMMLREMYRNNKCKEKKETE